MTSLSKKLTISTKSKKEFSKTWSKAPKSNKSMWLDQNTSLSKIYVKYLSVQVHKPNIPDFNTPLTVVSQKRL